MDERFRFLRHSEGCKKGRECTCGLRVAMQRYFYVRFRKIHLIGTSVNLWDCGGRK